MNKPGTGRNSELRLGGYGYKRQPNEGRHKASGQGTPPFLEPVVGSEDVPIVSVNVTPRNGPKPLPA